MRKPLSSILAIAFLTTGLACNTITRRVPWSSQPTPPAGTAGAAMVCFLSLASLQPTLSWPQHCFALVTVGSVLAV